MIFTYPTLSLMRSIPIQPGNGRPPFPTSTFVPPPPPPPPSSRDDMSIQCPSRPVWTNPRVPQNLCLHWNQTLSLWSYSRPRPSTLHSVGILLNFQDLWWHQSIFIPSLLCHHQGQKGIYGMVNKHLQCRVEKGILWRIWPWRWKIDNEFDDKGVSFPWCDS